MIRPGRRILVSRLRSLSLAIPLALGCNAAFAFERHHYEGYPELEGKPVLQVLLLGNNKTQDIVLLREIKTEAGQPFRSAELWRDWERLLDLGLFAEIEVDAVPSGDGVLAVFSVHERPSWFAAPILDYDIDERTITAGGQARLLNIGGMNRQFRVRALSGRRDSFSLSWTTPWVGSTKQALGLEFRADLPGRSNDELRSSFIGANTSRFLGDFKKVRRGINASARLEIIRRDANAPGGLIDQLAPTLGVGWFRDDRNVRIDPERGSNLSAGGEFSQGLYTDDLNYWRGLFDFSKFHRIGGPFLVAGRVQTVLTTGTVPSYRRFALGGGSSIRGQPSDIMAGKNFARTALELRIHLLSPKRIGFRIPLLPARIGRLSNFDLRVDGVLFTDSGTAWDNSEDFGKAPRKVGGGFGLRVFLPFVELLRLELAFDEDGNPTFYLREGNFI